MSSRPKHQRSAGAKWRDDGKIFPPSRSLNCIVIPNDTRDLLFLTSLPNYFLASVRRPALRYNIPLHALLRTSPPTRHYRHAMSPNFASSRASPSYRRPNPHPYPENPCLPHLSSLLPLNSICLHSTHALSHKILHTTLHLRTLSI